MALQLQQEKNSSTGVKDPLVGFTSALKLQRRITDKDRMFFTEQLSLLLGTGSNLHASLKALREQVENPAMKQLIDSLVNDIAEGRTFSRALSHHPRVFSQTYVNLVAASETGGFMDKVLEQLLEMDEKKDRLRNTLVSALSYPAFLLLFATAVVIFVLMAVFPKFSEMFSAISDQLPATTTFLMAVSETLRTQWPLVCASFIVALVFGRLWIRSPGGSRLLDRMKIGTPGIRQIFIKLYLVQSMRVMGLSLSNGVGIMETLSGCKEVVRNKIYRNFISDVQNRVEEGVGIAAGFSNARFIPPVVQQMITTGEETGNLPKVMSRLADYYERELSRNLATFTRLVEPVMLLVMGAIVGILVSSLILPIFKLSRAVH